MSEHAGPSDPAPVPSDDTLILTQADPTDLLRSIAELERACRDAEDDVVSAKASLLHRQKAHAECVGQLRKACREIDAPPMPLFTEPGPSLPPAGANGAAG